MFSAISFSDVQTQTESLISYFKESRYLDNGNEPKFAYLRVLHIPNGTSNGCRNVVNHYLQESVFVIVYFFDPFID